MSNFVYNIITSADHLVPSAIERCRLYQFHSSPTVMYINKQEALSSNIDVARRLDQNALCGYHQHNLIHLQPM